MSDRGILPDLCPETYTSAALADALAERMKAEGGDGGSGSSALPQRGEDSAGDIKSRRICGAGCSAL